VRATPATHDERRRPLGGPVAEPIGFDIGWNGRRAYFAGDTAEFEGMAALGEGLDLALLPVAGWGPSLGPGHLDPGEAAAVAALLEPRLAVPIHWGTYFPAGLAWRHPGALLDPPRQFAAQVAELAPAVEVRAVSPGGSIDL
jgi:L-ascorbate metabolism protein UlaG (beta-lactamase superfamily)